MNRSAFKTLSRLRIKEAKVLLANSCYPGAYYLAGYSIECALKACIARMTKRYDFPDKKLAADSHTHDLEKLLKIANLSEKHKEATANPAFSANWTIVKDWSEQDRYDSTITKAEAHDLVEAITEPANGVLAWVKMWW